MVAGPEGRRQQTQADSDFIHADDPQPIRQFLNFLGVTLSITDLDEILETVR